MFKNHLLVAFRNFKRQKVYSLINIIGFAIGFSVCLIITFYIRHDLTFDRFHDNAENIYRVLSVAKKTGTVNAITSGPLIAAVKDNIPEIKASTRVTSGGIRDVSLPGAAVSEDEESSQAVTAEIIYADSNFFDVFDFKILAGAEGDVLKKPGSVFLTPRVAKALFGEKNPLGEPISIRQVENAHVVGIVEAPPSNSHIQFGMIIPLIPESNPTFWNSWENLGLRGYVSLYPNADPAQVNKKMEAVAEENNFVKIFKPELQPLLDIHLGSGRYLYDLLNRGKNDILIIYIMGAIGLLIILTACINFISLSTSRATKRSVEVGIRKVVGANRKSLAFQFLGESLMMAIIAFLIALIITKITLPYLDDILEKKLELNFLENPLLILLLFAIAALIGLLAGIFPAVVLSSFKPANILRGKFHASKRGVALRRILVVFQFVFTIAAILSALFVLAQINFIKSSNMGYNREQVVVVVNRTQGDTDLLKNSIKTIPGVSSCGRCSGLPGGRYFTRYEVIRDDCDRTNSYTAPYFNIDEDFLQTLDISLVKGRNFSKQFATEPASSAIVNETLIKEAGWDLNNFTDKFLSIVNDEGTIINKRVIGVIKDFHFLTARQSIEPMVLFFDPQRSPFLFVQLTPGQFSQSIERIEKEFKKLYPGQQMRRFFLDEVFETQFNNDKELARNVGIFAGITIFIACLGLIGLVSYAIEQRHLEIVVRKIYGCSELRIVKILSVDFLKWVLLANLIAWPAGYFAVREWLSQFVYRVPLTVWPFVLAAVSSFVIAFFALSFQVFKASRTNPADILREVG